jgi:hypothetical protein
MFYFEKADYSFTTNKAVFSNLKTALLVVRNPTEQIICIASVDLV